jgi:hypothetical protein
MTMPRELTSINATPRALGKWQGKKEEAPIERGTSPFWAARMPYRIERFPSLKGKLSPAEISKLCFYLIGRLAVEHDVVRGRSYNMIGAEIGA